MSQQPSSPPPPRPMNPLPGTTIDTGAELLGVPKPESEDSSENATSLTRSPSGSFVKRTIEKLSRSTSKTRGGASRGEDHPPSGHRRLFSLSKRNKNDHSKPAESHMSHREIGRENLESSVASSADDSPFIRPPSPVEDAAQPNRPSILNFRGTGSMRAGTQTLIQALQAMPWTEEADNEEEPSSSEDDRSGTDEEAPALASSIHALYKPVEHARRVEKSPVSEEPPEYFGIKEGHPLGQLTRSPEELREDDFEISRPEGKPPPGADERPGISPQGAPIRTGSMATVRLQRRTRLATKLREVFEVEEIDEVVAEMPCWLLRSVLLQGYLYLTNAHLCFFAHIPSKEDQILKSGSLQKKNRTKRWTKFWFVLKNDAVLWYNSSSDPYFPRGVLNLRYAISCEPTGQRGLRLRANDRSITLSSDSGLSRDEWVKAIRKVIFKAQNMGESVKIVIPYSLIVDAEKSTALDFSESIEVKVMEKTTGYSVDSYFFAYFRDPSHALDQIRELVRSYKHSSPREGMDEVKDTTAPRPPIDHSHSPVLPEKALLPPEHHRPSSFRFSSLLRPFAGGQSGHRPEMPSFADSEPAITPSRTSQEDPSSSVNTLTTRAVSMPTTASSEPEHVGSITRAPFSTSPQPLSDADEEISIASDHTYPPNPVHGASLPPHVESHGSWNVSVPSWLRVPGRRVFSSINFLHTSSDRVREVYSPGPLEAPSEESSNAHMGFSIIESKEAPMDAEVLNKFRASFALDEKETLYGYFPGYLFRVLPVHGKFYISSNYLCFRSSQPLAKTRMIIPLKDILTSEPTKGYRFGMQGLVLIIKGHEELFFEFNSTSRRDIFGELLGKHLERIHEREHDGRDASPSPAKREALFLEELDVTKSLCDDSEPGPAPESQQAESLPAVMFTSSSSTFLTFKPKDPLHFTFLTIGSRGDVQPYIALGRRLLEEGHRVRIATHGEFKEWIESYNIEFAYVGGDPAELMRICVENGMFTVSFLKEGAAKFRGWIDDLLKTSWEACQGTDVLVESPSAMGGIHIAEALKIPYFRAFTMPWTRTRAYPHAFAVPERKMGGAYNYMTYVMFDQVFWRGTSGQINRWRRKVLGLGSTNLDKMEQHKVPFLYNFSPAVVPPPLDWYEWIHVTGYWFLDDADVGTKKWTPPPSLLKFMDNAHALGKKVVYIGFGSIVVSDPEAMTKCVVEAIVRSGVHAILSKGWSDRLSMKRQTGADEAPEEFPPQIYPVSSIPHDWLFARIDAACHHGGAGTTGASLRAGIPTIIKPFFGDQYFWADRVEALGIGSSVRKLTTDHLTAALITATTDTKQISKAKLVGESIRSEDGVGKAVECLYRDLEYARSLIKRGDESSDIENIHHISRPPSRMAGGQSSSSGRPASEDWSVISEQDYHHRMLPPPHNEEFLETRYAPPQHKI